jgi:hypothetical protein
MIKLLHRPYAGFSLSPRGALASADSVMNISLVHVTIRVFAGVMRAMIARPDPSRPTQVALHGNVIVAAAIHNPCQMGAVWNWNRGIVMLRRLMNAGGVE